MRSDPTSEAVGGRKLKTPFFNFFKAILHKTALTIGLKIGMQVHFCSGNRLGYAFWASEVV